MHVTKLILISLSLFTQKHMENNKIINFLGHLMTGIEIQYSGQATLTNEVNSARDK